MEPYKIQEMIDKYLNGQASLEEIKIIEEFYASFENKPSLTEQLTKEELDSSIKQGFLTLLAALRR